MDPVKLESVLEECEKTIARYPVDPYYDINEVCLDDYQHSDKYLIGIEVWSQPCIRVDAKKAE